MAAKNYDEIRQLIINTLEGRPAGTMIYPEGHQEIDLSILDFANAISSVISTGIAGEAQASTQPIQPSGSNVAYIFQVAPDSTKTFTNFRDSGGNAISVTTNSSQAAVGFLLWNGSYWSAMTVYIAVTSPAFETISSDIIQLLDGTTPVYPRTKAEAVFFDNDTTKTLNIVIATKVTESRGKNLFDKNHLSAVGRYQNSNGTTSPNSDYSVSDYIPVLPETNYYLSARNDEYTISSAGAYICFFNSARECISYLPGNTKAITTPANTAFLRFSIYNTVLNLDTQLEQGNARTDYELYTDIYNKPANVLTPNTVGTTELKNNAVTTPKIADGAVTEDKIGNGSVSENKISDSLKKTIIDNKVDKKSKNLVDWYGKDAPITNRYYKASTGAIVSGPGDRTYCRVPLIPIKPNTDYYLSCLRNGVESGLGSGGSSDIGICFYTSEGITGFISSVPRGTRAITTPENAAFIGISCYNFDSITQPCLQEGTARDYSPYNPISGYLTDEMLEPKDGSITTPKIASEAVIEEKTIFFDKLRNLFDKNAVTLDKYVASTGGLSSNVDYAASDFIPVDPEMGYIVSNYYGISGAYNCFYDANKQFISYFQSMPVAIPQNAAFVRISITPKSRINSTQVEYGQERTEYVPYGYILKSKYIPSENVQKQKLVLPKKLYMLSGVNFDIFYEPILRLWNPYRYDVKANTLPTDRAYVKAIKRVCTLNTDTAEPSSLSLSIYDDDVEQFILTKSASILKGTSGVGSSEVKIGIMGDSYTDGGCFTPTLLDATKVPNLKMVGTRSVNNGAFVNQRLDGRSGWTLGTFFNVVTGADYFNPFYHPQGNHRYWGNTAFWANVCGGSPSGYGIRYAHYASLCNASGWPVSPVEGDVIYDSTNSVFKEYQSGSWVQVANSVAAVKEYYTWEWNYAKYLSMWNIETADIFCVYLGVNDFWVNTEPSDDNLATWKTRLDAVIASYHSVNASGKFVVLCPNTVTNPNVNHYQRLDVHRRMFKLREFIISNYDQRESELIYVVDTAHLIDSENSYTINETNPFDGYPNGYSYDNKEVWAGDGQHPRVSYTTIGYSLAGFIQNVRS